MTEEKKELLTEIEDLARELNEYIDDLKTSVDEAVDEAEEIAGNEQAIPDRMIEIRNALKRVTDNQEQDLNI